jgi:hypothetical protein
MKHSIINLAARAMIICLAATQLFLFLPACATVTNKAYAENRHITATWLWNTYSIWREKDKTLDFLGQNGVNVLFLQIDEDIPAGIYSDFIQEASSRGIEVHALGGAPDWVLPDGQRKLYRFIDWVHTYNNNVRPVERFNGIHLDIEPYVLPEWQKNPDTLLGYWKDTVSAFAQQVKADSHLTVSMDLPVWLDGLKTHDKYGRSTTLSSWMMDNLDQVTLMAYLDNSQNIIKSVANEIDEAEKTGTPVIIGVDTFNNEAANSSFYTKGKSNMLSELNTVAQGLSNKSSFVGYAVHDYDSWSRLKE